MVKSSMLSRTRTCGCAVKLSFRSRPLISRRRRRRRFEGFPCTQNPWYGLPVIFSFRLTKPSIKANIVREVSVRLCGSEAGSFSIGHSQSEAVTTQECVSHFEHRLYETPHRDSCAEDTRYTNPLKQKYKAKRLAAECTNHLRIFYPLVFLTTSF